MLLRDARVKLLNVSCWTRKPLSVLPPSTPPHRVATEMARCSSPPSSERLWDGQLDWEDISTPPIEERPDPIDMHHQLRVELGFENQTQSSIGPDGADIGLPWTPEGAHSTQFLCQQWKTSVGMPTVTAKPRAQILDQLDAQLRDSEGEAADTTVRSARTTKIKTTAPAKLRLPDCVKKSASQSSTEPNSPSRRLSRTKATTGSGSCAEMDKENRVLPPPRLDKGKGRAPDNDRSALQASKLNGTSKQENARSSRAASVISIDSEDDDRVVSRGAPAARKGRASPPSDGSDEFNLPISPGLELALQAEPAALELDSSALSQDTAGPSRQIGTADEPTPALSQSPGKMLGIVLISDLPPERQSVYLNQFANNRKRKDPPTGSGTGTGSGTAIGSGTGQRMSYGRARKTWDSTWDDEDEERESSRATSSSTRGRGRGKSTTSASSAGRGGRFRGRGRGGWRGGRWTARVRGKKR